MALHPPLSPLTHHWDNVTAPHGRPNFRSRLHFRHAQEGGPRSPQKDMWWHWGKKVQQSSYLNTNVISIFTIANDLITTNQIPFMKKLRAN